MYQISAMIVAPSHRTYTEEELNTLTCLQALRTHLTCLHDHQLYIHENGLLHINPLYTGILKQPSLFSTS